MAWAVGDEAERAHRPRVSGERTVGFRPLARSDFSAVARWLEQEHVHRWWPDARDAAAIEAHYGPSVEGSSPTLVFVVEIDGASVGLMQCYRLADYPDWQRAVGGNDAAGIDYLIGEPSLIGRGIGSATISAFVSVVFTIYPDIHRIVAAPQQANIPSWRALERAGFSRVFAGPIDSDDPSDAGPAYVYVRDRSPGVGAV